MFNSEIEYKKLFNNPNYNSHSNRELRFQFVMDYIKKTNVKTLVDIGSGRGNLIKELIDSNLDLKISSVDLDKFHQYNIPFYKMNILNHDERKILSEDKFDLLTCLDVMEHLEKSKIDDIFEYFSKISNFQIFTIANHPDIQNGIDIHNIQENLPFWINSIKKSLKINYIKRVKFFSKPDDSPHLKRFNYLYIFITSSTTENKVRNNKVFLFEKLNDTFKNMLDKIILTFK